MTPRCVAPPAGCLICTARRTTGAAGGEAFVDDLRQRLARQRLADPSTEQLRGSAQSASGRPSRRAAGGIQRPHMPVVADDEQAGGHAGDDLVAQPLGRFGARLHRALLLAQAAQRLLHRGRHERRLGALAFAVFRRRARRGEDLHHREGEDPASAATIAVRPRRR